MKRIKPQAMLLDYNVNPEENTAASARLCYSSQDPEKILNEFDREEIERLNKKIVELGHHSILEHSYFYFWLRGSRVFTHQLVRQRVGVSYSQRSQRYVAEDNFGYIIPPSIEESEEATQAYLRHIEEGEKLYNELLEKGIPKEDARFALHQGVATDILVSYNARSLLHFFKLRCCTRAQWEIREIANQMLAEARKAVPQFFKDAGPSCISEGRCNEGEMSCGRLDKT